MSALRSHPIPRIALTILCAMASACATIPREPFTADEQARAVPVGFANVRYASGDPGIIATMRDAAIGQRAADATAPLSVLALSGGGANGAYGAGLLYGWSKAGGRPRFTIVSGVSTGALIAPFAFLGPAWDEELRRAYTDGHASHLLKFRGLRTLTSNSVFSGKPLRALIAGFVTDRLLDAVAAEHRAGRRLLVATADLDSQKLVVWDMGAIAAHRGNAGNAANRGGAVIAADRGGAVIAADRGGAVIAADRGGAARELFIQVMVASASIPGIFPPVMIPTVAGDHLIREMHVDGTTINAFFAVPDAALLLKDTSASGGTIYILINGKAGEEFAVARDSLLSIVSRSYDTATKASQRTALTAVAAFGQNNGIATRLAAIPPQTIASSLDFARPAMERLFALGQARGSSAAIWDDLPQALAGGTGKTRK